MPIRNENFRTQQSLFLQELSGIWKHIEWEIQAKHDGRGLDDFYLNGQMLKIEAHDH